MINKIGPLLLLLCLWSGCGDQTSTNQDQSTQATQPENTAAPAPQLEKPYPSLPAERMQELFNLVDYVDFVFYYTNFSMNQSDNASIKATLANVSTEVPGIDPACQPIGRLFFQSKGQVMIEADLYFTQNCVYYVWLVNGQARYANRMTEDGFKFYEKIFAQVSAQQQ